MNAKVSAVDRGCQLSIRATSAPEQDSGSRASETSLEFALGVEHTWKRTEMLKLSCLRFPFAMRKTGQSASSFHWRQDAGAVCQACVDRHGDGLLAVIRAGSNRGQLISHARV